MLRKVNKLAKNEIVKEISKCYPLVNFPIANDTKNLEFCSDTPICFLYFSDLFGVVFVLVCFLECCGIGQSTDLECVSILDLFYNFCQQKCLLREQILNA